MKDLVGDTVVLTHRELLELAPAIAFAIGAHVDAHDAIVVLRQPILTAGQTLGLDFIQGVLVLLPRLQVWRMVLGKVRKELRAVGVAHVDTVKALSAPNGRST